ncbi:MAG: tRNA nucleotidyltransferase [Oscillospiraceae bacterium]|nr:tRNA nucleotidyltransferase [Oscillospiraceae bacterium]
MEHRVPDYVNMVMRALRDSGYRVYLVGGCVRDLLRAAQPADYDLTTDAHPEQMLALFGASAHPTGLQHGTVTVVSEGHPIEITTMRRDGAYRDNRHPEQVSFTGRIEDDLARRDFTVNAMAMAEDGALIDPFDGRKDLAEKTLRCVGNARVRFEEDALRMLRLLRFAAVLGFSVEKETARAAREACARLRTIAAERVYAELNKLLCGENVTKVLLSFPEVLGAVIPEILPCVGFDQRNPHHCFDVWEHTARSVGFVPPQRELRWTMLFHDLGKPLCLSIDKNGVGHFYGHTARSAELAETIMENLRFEKELRTQVRAQLACFDDMFPPERAAIHREMAKRGREVVGNLLLTKLADNAAKAPAGLERAQKPWRVAQDIYDALVSEGACCAIGELAISGEDLLSLGFTGKAVGLTLHKLLDEVAAEKLENTHQALLTRAQRLHRSGFGAEKQEGK